MKKVNSIKECHKRAVKCYMLLKQIWHITSIPSNPFYNQFIASRVNAHYSSWNTVVSRYPAFFDCTSLWGISSAKTTPGFCIVEVYLTTMSGSAFGTKESLPRMALFSVSLLCTNCRRTSLSHDDESSCRLTQQSNVWVLKDCQIWWNKSANDSCHVLRTHHWRWQLTKSSP